MLTPAEGLLALANRIKCPKGVLVYTDDGLDSSHLAKVALALRFSEERPRLRLRAIVENWDMQRITREVY
jgi:hypothetical protein